MTDITVFGELLIDFTDAGTSANGNRLFEQNPGGAVANVACAAVKFGKSAAYIGKVGNDMHGRFLKETLDKAGVSTRGLILDDRYFTTLAFVALSPGGERSFSFARKPGADTCFRPEELDGDMLRDTAVLHVGSLSLTDEPSRSATYEAVAVAKDAGAIISYDPNYRASLWNSTDVASEMMRSIVPYTDVMKFSDDEAELLTGVNDPDEALRILASRGVKIAVVTMGAQGADFIFGGQIQHVPGFKVPVTDTTGAGDAFWGGFLACLVSAKKRLGELTVKDIWNFVEFGNAVAACCIQKRGAIPALPDYETILKFLADTKK